MVLTDKRREKTESGIRVNDPNIPVGRQHTHSDSAAAVTGKIVRTSMSGSQRR
jgi:hypothetical protein